MEEADEYQSDLVDEIKKFTMRTKPKNNEKKQEKEIVKEKLHNFNIGRETILNAFKSKIFLPKFKG